MHYFNDRREAGRTLADKLAVYATQDCVIVALSEGGVIVGAEIAVRLKAPIYLLTIENVGLEGETDPIGLMSGGGSFIYNSMFSAGQLEEILSDSRPLIDQERMKTFQKLNRVLGKDGVIDKEQLKRRTIVLVSDGLKNGLSIDVAADFVKVLVVKKLIIATPVASVPAVERMHLLADEICCLGIADNYISTDHYYQNSVIPSHDELVKLMKDVHPPEAPAASTLGT
jgi:putative phosphoribosyl transferase